MKDFIGGLGFEVYSETHSDDSVWQPKPHHLQVR